MYFVKVSRIKVLEVKFEPQRIFYFYFFYVGEGKDVTKEITGLWKEITLTTISCNYDFAAIFNIDEFGLLYQAFHEKKDLKTD